jgi:hypothetical protein
MTNHIVIEYSDDLEHLLKIHAEECESLGILHLASYEKFNRRSNYINIPVIILSSAIGFATGIDIGYDNMNIILGVGSIFVGIIKSIDTYFQLQKRAEGHRMCSLQYEQINKKIQIELALDRTERQSAKDMLNIIKTDIKNLQDISPLIDKDIIVDYNKKYGQYTTVKKPNFVNGLSEVFVNANYNINKKQITPPSLSADLVFRSNTNTPKDNNSVMIPIDNVNQLGVNSRPSPNNARPSGGNSRPSANNVRPSGNNPTPSSNNSRPNVINSPIAPSAGSANTNSFLNNYNNVNNLSTNPPVNQPVSVADAMIQQDPSLSNVSLEEIHNNTM